MTDNAKAPQQETGGMKHYLAYMYSEARQKLYWLGANPLQLTTDRKYAVRFNSIELLNQSVGPHHFLIETEAA